MTIKETLKRKLREAMNRRKRNKKHEQELKAKIRIIQRKEYAKERIRLAKSQARRKARGVSRKREGYFDQPISPVLNQLMFGSPQQKNKLLDI